MKFKILNIGLVPNDSLLKPRLIPFNLDYVNVITGASERGKSALIFVIDYCLGASNCRIPIGLIRKTTNWFCLHIRLENQETIICRRSPVHTTSDFYIESGSNLAIKEDYIANSSLDTVKAFFRSKLGLSNMPIESNDSDDISAWGGAVGIRDLVSLLYQPQNIIANSNALFYRTETFQYRERLRKIMPFLLNIVNADILNKRERLKILKREKTIIEKRIARYSKSQSEWQTYLRGYYVLSLEYNLLSPTAPTKASELTSGQLHENMRYAERYLDVSYNELPRIQEGISKKIAMQISGLMERQDMISSNIQRLKSKIVSLKRLQNANSEYFKRLNDQADRIHSVDWFLDNLKSDNCFACGNEINDNYLQKVDLVEEDIKSLKYKVEDFTKVNSREIFNLEKLLLEEEKALNDARNEINNLTIQDENFKVRNQSIKRLYTFLGELKEVLSNYQNQFSNNDDSESLAEINRKIHNLEIELAKNNTQLRKKSILGKISKKMSHYAKMMNAEKSNDTFELDINELTVKFFDEDDVNYLWEIGSAHNYLSYHLATLLAIHEYLAELNTSIVPQFLIIDQPSQVYFPELPEDGDEGIDEDDLKRVEKIFSVLSNFNERVKGAVQVIILEHVGNRNFSGFNNIVQLQRWRDKGPDTALIPDSWVE